VGLFLEQADTSPAIDSIPAIAARTTGASRSR